MSFSVQRGLSEPPNAGKNVGRSGVHCDDRARNGLVSPAASRKDVRSIKNLCRAAPFRVILMLKYGKAKVG
jgi:hypothetical protein